MVSSNGLGLMAVVAVSGTVVLVALQLHKRLVSEFMKKVEFEFGVERNLPKKKVRFAKDVVEPSSNNKEYRQQRSRFVGDTNLIRSTVEIMNGDSVKEMLTTIPLNRLVL
ncbi:uncharacterized protein LOC143883544 [Tasmannia lanceolata]|uniref:uncharacterized protein LOC143883544 n=1 Tax=Tasmannia lanceolata TaxID=3420 RepID=UPI00406401AD